MAAGATQNYDPNQPVQNGYGGQSSPNDPVEVINGYYHWRGNTYTSLTALQAAQNSTGTPASPNVLNPAQTNVNGGGAGSVYSVGPQGQTAYSVTPNTQAYDAAQAKAASDRALAASQALLNQRAALNQQSLEQRFAMLNSSQGTAPHVAGESPSDDTASANAIFARAKDQAGGIAASGIAGLRDAMDSRGLTDSSLERAGTGQQIAGAAGALGDVNREQAIQALVRANQLQDRNYQGDITQRGQDLAAKQSLMGLIMSGGALY